MKLIVLDNPEDEDFLLDLIKRNESKTEEKGIPNILMLLTDCDGCLTDGGMYYSENGDELKKFNTKDGMGFSLLRDHGIITGIITSESVDLNRRRAEKLKLDILETGCKDKLTTIKKICKERGILLQNVCYIGDDINDIEAIKAVGYGCCPADAILSVRKNSDYITLAKGGGGVIREVVDKILSQNAYQNKTE